VCGVFGECPHVETDSDIERDTDTHAHILISTHTHLDNACTLTPYFSPSLSSHFFSSPSPATQVAALFLTYVPFIIIKVPSLIYIKFLSLV